MIALNKYSEKGVKLTIYITTIAVCALVVVLNQKWIPHPDTFPSFIYKLPMVNALAVAMPPDKLKPLAWVVHLRLLIVLLRTLTLASTPPAQTK
jgi:hypothetical protein